jgi:hypothetical protein
MWWTRKRSLNVPVPLAESVLEEVPVFLPPPVFPPPQPSPASPTKIARRASIANQLRPRLGSAKNSDGGTVVLSAESQNSALLAFVSGGIGKPEGGCIIARFSTKAEGLRR